ncbi:MAG TPA: alpha/beta hydrolase [Devosiaceae bacterium]
MVDESLELLLLHALPLSGDMWAGQMHLLPGATYAPTLYPLGGDIKTWAREALRLAKGSRIVVVGCSVGGSCALEIAALAPHRIAGMVLIGTKANCRPDPGSHAAALRLIEEEGLETTWRDIWEPLFGGPASLAAIEAAKRIALAQPPGDVARGVTAFHTRPSREHVLSTFERPVAVISGAQDTAPGVPTSRRQAELAPHGRLHIIPDCGHYVPLEQPQALNAILREIITEQSA